MTFLKGNVLAVKHGLYKSRVYRTWIGMKARCFNRSHPFYRYYGGRGIRICKRWLRFENFFEDMGEHPKGQTLERIKNNRGYAPGNCRWASRGDQVRNRRNNIRLSFEGRSMCLAEWAHAIGMKPHTLFCRIRVSGWSIERALTEPIQKKMRNSRAK